MYLINSKSGIIPQELAELFRYKDKINNGIEDPIQFCSISWGRLLKKLSGCTAEHHLQNRSNVWVMTLLTSPSFDPTLSPTSGV